MTATQPTVELEVDGRDLAVETWLDDHGIPYLFDPAVPLDRIDKARSLANQARLEPLDPEVVDRYTADMRRGDQFPPLLALNRGPRKLLQLLGGNHRYHAHHNADHTTAPAYVVTCDPAVALVLTYEDNRRHGLPPSNDERVHQAIHLIDNGMTPADAAAAVGVTEGLIKTQRTLVEVTRRANTLDLPRAFHDLPKMHRARLSAIRSDPVFAAAAEHAVEARLPQQAVYDLVSKVNAARSDADALTLIGTISEDHRTTQQQPKLGPTARSKLQGALTTIAALDPAAVAAATPNRDVASTVRKQLLAAASILQAVDKALKAL